MKGVRPMKKENEKIEKALAAAYRDRTGPEPGEGWELSVMRSIRSIPDVPEKAPGPDLVGKLFWEICPAACAVIVFLAIASYRINVAPADDFARMVAPDNTIEMMLADTNG